MAAASRLLRSFIGSPYELWWLGEREVMPLFWASQKSLEISQLVGFCSVSDI
jgi:hypothetical protein